MNFGMGLIVEFMGECICDFLMEECMIICNMFIEVGVKVGLISSDDVMFFYIKGC